MNMSIASIGQALTDFAFYYPLFMAYLWMAGGLLIGLRSVPEIAGAHHETMDGKGYPRGLKREEMSWQARMMAVADIFEALTAGDRPYKSSKTLREALKIMDKFKEQNHIDPEVYDLFVKSGIPQKYAADYLKPEQNDL